jgi:hypothetical protein
LTKIVYYGAAEKIKVQLSFIHKKCEVWTADFNLEAHKVLEVKKK